MRRNGCYRKALTVKEQIQLQNSTYPICPRCGIMLEREHMKFCDNCGQRLKWTHLMFLNSIYQKG